MNCINNFDDNTMQCENCKVTDVEIDFMLANNLNCGRISKSLYDKMMLTDLKDPQKRTHYKCDVCGCNGHTIVTATPEEVSIGSFKCEVESR